MIKQKKCYYVYRADEEKSKRFNQYLKSFYDFLKLHDDIDTNSNSNSNKQRPSTTKSTSQRRTTASSTQLTELPELIIDAELVDIEQIYQQLQLLNANGDASASVDALTRFFAKTLVHKDALTFNIAAATTTTKKKTNGKMSRSSTGSESQSLHSHDSLFEDESGEGDNDDDDDDDVDDDEDDGEDGDEDSDADSVDRLIKSSLKLKLASSGIGKAKPPKDKKETAAAAQFGIPDGSDSEISDFEVNDNEDDDEDDDEDEDEDEEGKKGGLDEDEADDLDSDEVDDDLVDLYEGELGDEKEVMGLGKPAKSFDQVDFDREDFGLNDIEGVAAEDEDEDDGEDGEEEEEEKEKRPLKGNKEQPRKQQPRDLFNADDDKDDKGGKEEAENKSSFEIRQEKLREQIDQVHESMLGTLNDKKWQLKGEVTAKTRPQDSLLEEYLDFDHTTRQMPAPSATSSETLEAIIKQRIKDKAFDDVERKVKPVEAQHEYRKQVALDHQKSKVGLGEVYEQEFLKQQQALVNDETSADAAALAAKSEALSNPKHEEIRKLMQSLFVKLDALSNFHFTPKPVCF